MAQSQKLYTRTWKNTGMEGTPIYVYQTPNPNGTLGSAVGDIIMLSEDTSRKYIIHSYGVEIVGTDKVAYFEDVQKYGEEYGTKAQFMMYCFVERAEEAFTRLHSSDCRFEEIATALEDIMGFKCVRYQECEYDDYIIEAYRPDIAKKAHIGENCSFCFSKESARECMAMYPNSTCSFELEEVLMIYPDNSTDESIAYVVYHE